MPTYEYVCDSCRHEFEREQRITESAIKKCPKCGKLKVRRLITGGNFILKGGGWESDLYSGPSNRAEKKSGSEDKGKGSSDSTSGESGGKSKESAGTGGDAKPAKATESKAGKPKKASSR